MTSSHFAHYARYLIVGYFLVITNISAIAHATEAKAIGFIDQISQEAIQIIQAKNDAEDLKVRRLNRLFDRAVDTDWIAKFVMGRHWNQLTDTQKTSYTEVFQKYLANQYVPKFQEYNNQKYKIHKATSEQKGEYTVMTTIYLDGKTPISVNYKLHMNHKKQLQIFDVVAEGISLVNTQRSEFGSVLSRKGPEFLITALTQKTQIAAY